MASDLGRAFDLLVGSGSVSHRLTGQAGTLSESSDVSLQVLEVLGNEGFERIFIQADHTVAASGVVRMSGDLDAYLDAWKRGGERQVFTATRAAEPRTQAATGRQFAGSQSRECYYGRFLLDDYAVSDPYDGLALMTLSMAVADDLSEGKALQWWGSGNANAATATPADFDANADLAVMVYDHRPSTFRFTGSGGFTLDGGVGKTSRLSAPGVAVVEDPDRARMVQTSRANNGREAAATDYHWGWVAWLRRI